jgi:hypothetical protein
MVQIDDGTGGCNPTNWANQSATGFVGIGGTSPVPSTPVYTCDGTSVKCANENASGCSLRYPAKKCRSTFTYPGGGVTTGPCACQCIN